MIDPEVWLAELFEFELCDECGRDAEDHTAVPLMGNWFARCNEEPDDGKVLIAGVLYDAETLQEADPQ